MIRKPAGIILALSATLLASAPALAQMTPPARPAALAVDAAYDAQKAAFLALQPTQRKAIQDALVWLGFYNGTNDGDFGKRTRDAIVAWQRSVKATPDGVLGPALLMTLLAAAQKARADVGFKTIDDPKTGVRIGSPTKLIAPNGAKLDLTADAGADLAAVYARLSAETPARKVAYKAMKPGAFFVVSGQDGDRKFYSRFEKNDQASPPIRGFTFSYPAARGDLDRVAIAVANSFDAFPKAAQAIGTPTAQQGPETPAPGLAPAPPAQTTTALVIGPGKALTALKADECPNPTIHGTPVRFERTDDASGLAILNGDFGGKSAVPELGKLSSDLVLLSRRGEKVAVTAASLASRTPALALVSIEKSERGAPIFDRQGRLVGLIAPVAQEPKRVGGAPVAESRAMIQAEAIGGFLGGGVIVSETQPRLTAGEIAEKNGVVGVYCAGK